MSKQTEKIIEKSPFIEAKQYVAIYQNWFFQAAKDIKEALQRPSHWHLILKKTWKLKPLKKEAFEAVFIVLF